MAESVQEQSNQKNLPGVYKHPETGEELVAHNHPKFGSAMADGFVRVGYVYQGPEKQESEAQESKKGNK